MQQCLTRMAVAHPWCGAGDGVSTHVLSLNAQLLNPIDKARPVFATLPSDAFLCSRSS